MEIFSWILTFFEVIGIVLLAVFGILLFFIVLILFGGIKYYIFVEKKEDVFVNFKVSFLGFVRFVIFSGEENKSSYLRIFGIKFFKNTVFENEKEDFDESFQENEKLNNETEISKIGLDERKQAVFEEEDDDILNKTKEEKKFKKENNIFDNVKNVYDKFTCLKNYPQKGDILKDSLNLLKKLFFAIKPKKFKINLLIGFDDPSDTGKFIGLMSVVSEFVPFEINSYADFEKEVFEGDLFAKGKTRIFKIGFPILKYILKKPIWNIIKNRKG